VEKLTGYTFFPTIPAEVAEVLRARVDDVEIRIPRTKGGGD
jgi:hypothetical protein